MSSKNPLMRISKYLWQRRTRDMTWTLKSSVNSFWYFPYLPLREYPVPKHLFHHAELNGPCSDTSNEWLELTIPRELQQPASILVKPSIVQSPTSRSNNRVISPGGQTRRKKEKKEKRRGAGRVQSWFRSC